MTSLIYRTDGVTPEQLQQDLAEFWIRLRTDQELQQRARTVGFDPDRLASGSEEPPISLRPEGSGLDAASVAVIVAFAPVAAKVTRDLWDEVVLPWIRRRRGGSVLQPAPEAAPPADSR